jgi:hypothetical protein
VGRFQQALAYADAAFDDPAKAQPLNNALFGGFPLPPTKADFLFAISGYAMDAAQSGNVRTFCSDLAQDANPIDGLIGYANPPLTDDAPSKTPAAKLRAQGDRFIPDSQGEPAFDAWFYQTCAEVGLFTIANSDRKLSVMSDLIDASYYERGCDLAFHRRPNVAKTNATYFQPLAKGKVSNVFFVNGSDDPWSALSFNDPARPPRGLAVFVIQDGIHGEDLHNLQPNDLLGVFQAHKSFHDLAVRWLAQ